MSLRENVNSGDPNKEDLFGRSLIPPLIWVLNIGGTCGAFAERDQCSESAGAEDYT